MNNLKSLILALSLFALPAFSADVISTPAGSGNAFLTDSHGVNWPAMVGYTTDGNGSTLTLEGQALASDDVSNPQGSGKAYVTDLLGRQFPVLVLYTTDGNGTVIPITSGGGGGGVSSVSGTSPIVSSGGSTPAISLAKATSSVDGYLFHTDWSTFNSKQAAGSYITALTGDVTASGPGSVAATLANAKHLVFVDFISGDDSTGTGSLVKPWKTIAHTCATIAPTVNEPFVIKVSGGNNDTDSGAVSCPPNINIVSEYPVQITGTSFTITGGITNDSVSFTNLIFIGAFSWIRSDFTSMGVQFINSEFFSGPVVKQNGGGTASITGYDSVTVNADFKTGGTGSFFFNPNFLGATTTFEDANASAYYEVMGGYNSSNIQISGGAQIYLSGLQCDQPFGCAMTGATTANGTPVIQTDSGSVPPTIAGAFSANLISHAQWEAYSPALAANWSGAPITVSAALDKLVVLQQSPVGSQPACSSANRGLQWLVQGGAGVADTFQICQKTGADIYEWSSY